VRLTSSRGWRSSSVVALVAPENSAYASSTTTTPSLSAQTASTTSREVGVPVGLFGVVTNVMAGRCSRTAATADSADSEKSCARLTPTQPVLVPAAIRGCMEYDGSKPSATRPGPPKAWQTCWRTSLDPFAAHTCSVSSGTPVRRER